jgi:hypothetical protein
VHGDTVVGIRPIQTFYDGHRFRSRLEARWAVFFNTLNIPYEYEKEGYVLDSGLGTYLPDFWLPEQDCWIEIKGTAPTGEDEERLKTIVLSTKKAGYIFFGPIYQPKSISDDSSAIHLNFEYDEDGEHVGWDDAHWWCECHNCGALGIQFEGRGARIQCGCSHGDVGDSCSHDDRCHAFDTPRLVAAYITARSARFEYGEKG